MSPKPEAQLEARLVDIVRASPRLMTVMRAVRDAEVPNWRLVSGAVYQTVWNALTGRAPDYGIRDYDVFYFDPDPSWEAEDVIIKRLAAALPDDLSPLVEARNQARVHLWFPQKFGRPYAPLATTEESLERAASVAHAVAVRLEPDDRISVAAPFGLEDVFGMVLRPNPDNPASGGHAGKAASAKARWPELTVLED